MYEYRCAECGRQYEQLRRMSEADSDLKCPQCGATKVERLISACAIGGGASSGGNGGCTPRGGFS